ncbi:MAG: cysteine dioxygenase family protein [Deltaproteobacteria bacterium]|jgi:predicted metal-dependent enzyme (double-stranded beta helix superfamily)
MPKPPKPPEELLKICNRWSEAIEGICEDSARIEFFQKELPAFLRNDSVFEILLQNIKAGRPYPDLRQAQMIDDEILLYLNPKRLFSLRMFFYGPGDFTPIHDHSSWGVLGAAVGELGVVRYKREDDGSVKGYARLRRTASVYLQPGEIELTRSLNEGIHKTGNPGDGTTIMVSVYGSPVRRLYINCFDDKTHKVEKLYPPRIKKKMLAAQALKNFS